MDALESSNPEFEFNLAGRLRNVGLAASAANALIPMFEAVSNGLHAIELRWAGKAATEGQIHIAIHRSNDGDIGNVIGFTVTDNGVGLNAANWKSFLTSDSEFKIERGGKGVGRLAWLKAFRNCEVESYFEQESIIYRRCFTFKAVGSSNPISNHSLEVAITDSEIGTKVRLVPFASNFEAHCPRKAGTIAAKLVGHFLTYFVLGNSPSVVLKDGTAVMNLKDYFISNQHKSADSSFDLSFSTQLESEKFHIYHLLLSKQVKFFETGLHWMFFSGNDRVADQDDISSQLGLKYVGDDADCVYIALVTGEYLDRHVNQDRTSFTFDKHRLAEIHKAAVESAKSFLGVFISRVREEQTNTTARVIQGNPQFLTFREDLKGFVEENLSLNTHSEEDIFLELSRRKLRARRRLDGEIRSLKESGGHSVQADVERITKALNDEKKSSLAEYVVRRKAILELFDSSLAFVEPQKRKYYKEEVVHDLIIPLRADSEDLTYNQHNLWLLDDRLAFYTFFKSDRPFQTFTNAESNREPDLAVVFDRSLAFRRDGRDEPIIIVEFKRPGRDDFDGLSNPVTQVLEYVDLFRSGSAIRDKNGRVLKPIDQATRFICYIVADFTESLKRVVRSTPANQPTADGRGFFGISTQHNATIEVLPYEKLVHDARVRNEAFFERLGLV